MLRSSIGRGIACEKMLSSWRNSLRSNGRIRIVGSASVDAGTVGINGSDIPSPRCLTTVLSAMDQISGQKRQLCGDLRSPDAAHVEATSPGIGRSSPVIFSYLFGRCKWSRDVGPQ